MFKKEKGFTLIELLIVIAIIGILAALLIPNAMNAIQKARVRGTEKDINTIATTITDCITDRGIPPPANDTMDPTFLQALAGFYIKVLPTTDQWGNAFHVWTGQNVNCYGITGPGDDDFVVASYGRDGDVDTWTYNPATPNSGLYSIISMASFNNDIVNFNGAMIRCPRAAATGS